MDALISSHQEGGNDGGYKNIALMMNKKKTKASKTVLRGITKRKKKAQLKAEAHRDKMGTKYKANTLKRDKRHDAKNLY